MNYDSVRGRLLNGYLPNFSLEFLFIYLLQGLWKKRSLVFLSKNQPTYLHREGEVDYIHELLLRNMAWIPRQWKTSAVTWSGLFAILQIGFFLTLASYSFFTAFASHMIISEPSTPAGPVGSQGGAKKHSTKKTYASIVSEMLLGLYVTAIHILEYGMGSPAKTLDFGSEFLHSWLSVIFMGSLCVVIGDSFTATLCRSMAKGTHKKPAFSLTLLRLTLKPFTTYSLFPVMSWRVTIRNS